jgi:hypothetical protein
MNAESFEKRRKNATRSVSSVKRSLHRPKAVAVAEAGKTATVNRTVVDTTTDPVTLTGIHIRQLYLHLLLAMMGDRASSPCAPLLL